MNKLTTTSSNLPATPEDLARFVLVGREKLVAVRAAIRAIDRLDLAAEVREQKIGEAQALAGALLDAEARLGEMLREVPAAKNQYAHHSTVTSTSKSQTVKELGFGRMQAFRFETLADNLDVVEQVKAEAAERDSVPTREDVLSRVRITKKRKEVEQKVREYQKKTTAQSVDIHTTSKKYNIIYADPPWQYWEGGQKNQSLHYRTMAIDEICALPVQRIADDNCILFLWVTYPILPQAFDIITAWGFKYSTAGFVWVKRNKRVDSPFFGCGGWTRANSELCLIATKGSVLRLDAGISQVIDTPVEEHSRKPAIVRDLIVRLAGELPRIELFSREGVPGWDRWGDEI